jgi:hypothetical protein
MTYRENVVRGRAATEHIVQLFDDQQSLAHAVAAFLRDGLSAGDTHLVVMAPARFQATARRLRRLGVDVEEAIKAGRLTFRDAATTLKQLIRNGRPDPALFDATAGTLVRQLRPRRGRLRIYGEMVDLLAAEGDFEAAEQLEELWNDLGERESFTLLCGYSSVNFGDPRTGDALRLICRSHSHVRSSPRDLLGSYLVKAHGGQASRRSHAVR